MTYRIGERLPMGSGSMGYEPKVYLTNRRELLLTEPPSTEPVSTDGDDSTSSLSSLDSEVLRWFPVRSCGWRSSFACLESYCIHLTCYQQLFSMATQSSFFLGIEYHIN
jgi:hypothetical protein